jgi:TPR repeat protein
MWFKTKACLIICFLLIFPCSLLLHAANTSQATNQTKRAVLYIKQTEKLAIKGIAEAQYSLGRMYTRGLIEVELQSTDKLNSWLRIVRGRFIDPRIRAQNREGNEWLEKAAAQGHEGAIKHLKGGETWMGWSFLIIGIIFLPISIGLFKWPEIAEKHNPVVIRCLSVPLVFLFSLFGIIYEFKTLFL